MDRWGRSQMWFHKVFCDVAGRRHLPGICRYPAKCTGHAVNQGGTADKCFVRPWQKVYFCQGRFFETPLTEDITSKEFFLFQRGLRYGVFKTMVAYPAPNNFEYQNANFPHDFGKPLVFPRSISAYQIPIEPLPAYTQHFAAKCNSSFPLAVFCFYGDEFHSLPFADFRRLAAKKALASSRNMWRKWKWLYWPISGSSDLFFRIPIMQWTGTGVTIPVHLFFFMKSLLPDQSAGKRGLKT